MWTSLSVEAEVKQKQQKNQEQLSVRLAVLAIRNSALRPNKVTLIDGAAHHSRQLNVRYVRARELYCHCVICNHTQLSLKKNKQKKH